VTWLQSANDQTTPMELVVHCLMAHLSFTQEMAIAKMLEIHNTGGALIALSSEDEAKQIAEAMGTDCRTSGRNLICRHAGVTEQSHS
jgi:ATP-dependent Clp protease adapter protein ClpS